MFRVCPVCGEKFEISNKHKKYCSAKCAKEANKIRAGKRAKALYQRAKSDPALLDKHRETARAYANQKNYRKRCDAFGDYVDAILAIEDREQLAEYLARNFYIKYNNSNKGVDRR